MSVEVNMEKTTKSSRKSKKKNGSESVPAPAPGEQDHGVQPAADAELSASVELLAGSGVYCDSKPSFSSDGRFCYAVNGHAIVEMVGKTGKVARTFSLEENLSSRVTEATVCGSYICAAIRRDDGAPGSVAVWSLVDGELVNEYVLAKSG